MRKMCFYTQLRLRVAPRVGDVLKYKGCFDIGVRLLRPWLSKHEPQRAITAQVEPVRARTCGMANKQRQ